jgi:hypothetical protein
MTHFRPAKFLTLAPLLISAVACNARHSNSAFHPSWMTTLTGARFAFVTLGCNSCHEVAGEAAASDYTTASSGSSRGHSRSEVNRRIPGNGSGRSYVPDRALS